MSDALRSLRIRRVFDDLQIDDAVKALEEIAATPGPTSEALRAAAFHLRTARNEIAWAKEAFYEEKKDAL